MTILSELEKETVLAVLEWAKRMGESHGNIVISKNELIYDWGQALCREQFGLKWFSYMANNNIIIPTEEDLERAVEWENGNEPDWVDRYESK